jgi:hypothetical protein
MTVVSTMEGAHGNSERGTEVPRSKLIEALRNSSNFVTTEDLKNALCDKREFTV